VRLFPAVSITCRLAIADDVPAMARIRAAEWETEEYWTRRITAYLNGDIQARNALKTGVIYVAEQSGSIGGFIAGHLTRRFDCDGELEWINVVPEYRGSGVSSELMRVLAGWFIDRKALNVCVDPDDPARPFYIRHGAQPLNKHWLHWPDIRVLLDRNHGVPV
jgi:GNAT superfamily N-acetyltransferase